MRHTKQDMALLDRLAQLDSQRDAEQLHPTEEAEAEGLVKLANAAPALLAALKDCHETDTCDGENCDTCTLIAAAEGRDA